MGLRLWIWGQRDPPGCVVDPIESHKPLKSAGERRQRGAQRDPRVRCTWPALTGFEGEGGPEPGECTARGAENNPHTVCRATGPQPYNHKDMDSANNSNAPGSKSSPEIPDEPTRLQHLISACEPQCRGTSWAYLDFWPTQLCDDPSASL